jgi:hypothetical protein
MEQFERPMKRRKFLKRGILGGVLLVTIPPGKVMLTGTLQQETDAQRLHQIARRYGGEFGATRGGL